MQPQRFTSSGRVHEINRKAQGRNRHVRGRLALRDWTRPLALDDEVRDTSALTVHTLAVHTLAVHALEHRGPAISAAPPLHTSSTATGQQWRRLPRCARAPPRRGIAP